MNNLSQELVYALMIVAVVIFQFLMKRFGPQAPPESEEQEWLPPPPEAAEAASGSPAVSCVDVGYFGRTGVSSAPVQAQRRFSRSALMGSRREVQNAVVIATILGPCRSFEPHDVRS